MTQPRRIGGAAVFLGPFPYPACLRELDTLDMDFSKLNGLVPAVVQDVTTRDVLMVGFMNADALALTLASGYVTFFSRTRNRLWTKGETSGNRLAVRDLFTDCDRDTVLILAAREGDGLVCHEGTVSCFTRQLT